MSNEAKKIYRHIASLNRNQQTPVSQSQRGVSVNRSGKTGDGVVINCINNTGTTLDEYMCVKLVSGNTVLDPPYVIFPEIGDDPELALYGSVLNYSENGKIALVQISGKMIYRISGGSELIVIGEILYPLINQTDFDPLTDIDNRGYVGNKASGSSDLLTNSPIGRSLSDEDATTVIVEVAPVSASPDDSSIKVATVASTANLTTLSGIPSPIDGITLVADDIVLAKNQSTVADRKLYKVQSGAWEDLGQPEVVIVKRGTTNGRLVFMLTAANTYQGNNALPI